jgi:hypothetical protein
MDDVTDDLATIAQRCERVAKEFKSEPLTSIFNRFIDASHDVGRSWSQSWLGYHASVYLQGFRHPRGTEVFDREWGGEGYSSHTNGPWVIYSYEVVLEEIKRRCDAANLNLITEATAKAEEAFTRSKSEALPILDALIDAFGDKALVKSRAEIEALRPCLAQSGYIEVIRPKTFMSRDSRAYYEGPAVPHHVAFLTWLLSEASQGSQAGILGEKVRHVQRYIEVKHKMKGKSIARKEGKITIGHGRSSEWRELKTYLQDRLQLEVDEFNQQSVAGLANTERLDQMLDDSCFAFLVMTAEDEHSDGSQHARENVIHEVGLFQGRLGFKRAIVILEEVCKESWLLSMMRYVRSWSERVS